MTASQWKALVTAVGILAKAPTDAVFRAWEYAERAPEDEINNPARALIFGVDRK